MGRLEIVHAQNACAASYIQDNFISEKVLILVNSIAVGLGANFILEHLLVNA